MSAHPDEKRQRLREMVADVEQAMASADPEPARSAWKRLVAGLDLGPAPEVRSCPRCGGTGMRTASRCGHCWIALDPL